VLGLEGPQLLSDCAGGAARGGTAAAAFTPLLLLSL